MGGLGITAMNYGITDICYGITLKYLGINVMVILSKQVTCILIELIWVGSTSI